MQSKKTWIVFCAAQILTVLFALLAWVLFPLGASDAPEPGAGLRPALLLVGFAAGVFIWNILAYRLFIFSYRQSSWRRYIARVPALVTLLAIMAPFAMIVWEVYGIRLLF